MPDPIWIECEGSGRPVHPHPAMVLGGICSMCGTIVATFQRKAVGHRRQDILAMLNRGDFDA